MVLFSRRTRTPLAALTLSTDDDVGCLGMLTGRPPPPGASEPHFQGMLSMPDQTFSFVISNLCDDGMINFNVLHTPHRVSEVDPGPSYGVNEVNELHPNQSYEIEADQRSNRKMVLRGKTKIVKDPETSIERSVPVTVQETEKKDEPKGLYFYLSVVPDASCGSLVEKFAEGTVWKAAAGFVRCLKQPMPTVRRELTPPSSLASAVDVYEDIRYWDHSLNDEISCIRALLDSVSGAPLGNHWSALLEEAEKKIRNARGSQRSYKLECRLVTDAMERQQHERRLAAHTRTLGVLGDKVKTLRGDAQEGQKSKSSAASCEGANSGAVALLEEACRIQDRTQASLDNTRSMITSSREVGAATLEELERQRAQIEHISQERTIYDKQGQSVMIEHTMSKVDHVSCQSQRRRGLPTIGTFGAARQTPQTRAAVGLGQSPVFRSLTFRKARAHRKQAAALTIVPTSVQGSGERSFRGVGRRLARSKRNAKKSWVNNEAGGAKEPGGSKRDNAQFFESVDVGCTQAGELNYGRHVDVHSCATGHDYAYEHTSEPAVLCMSIWEGMKFLPLADTIEKQLAAEVEEWAENEGKALVESLNAVFKSDTCVIDLESEADTILCACGHQCVHHSNVGKLRLCPMCRSPVIAFVRADGIVIE
mmetsp:Transcript_2615/g.5622  ORF Transcript_2615/g.5622 Transcript_2615/m.5622 type:complete len:649 (-) Transcript_2615:173-2119(-)